MYKRIEKKLELKKNEYLSFLKWLKINNATVLFPERIVCSRYFDTYGLKMFRDTLEGITPRKKLRIRTYGSYIFEECLNKYNLEIKFNKDNDRFKEIIEDLDLVEFMSNPYYLSGYGFCYPSLDISYKREYFLIDGIRVTIDSEILYNNKGIIKTIHQKELFDNKYVVELKAEANNNSDLLENFNFIKTRFSKYGRGINSFLKFEEN